MTFGGTDASLFRRYVPYEDVVPYKKRGWNCIEVKVGARRLYRKLPHPLRGSSLSEGALVGAWRLTGRRGRRPLQEQGMELHRGEDVA